MANIETIAVVQARSSSSRLPGKVLLELAGAPVIVGILNRVSLCTDVDKVILATSDDSSDDQLASRVQEAGFEVVRGPLDDVLGRFEKALEIYPAQYCIRITGDCPFIDPDWISRVLAKHKMMDAEYSSNALNPSLPDGLDCEVINVDTLKTVANLANESIDREHVTHYIYTHPEDFRICSVTNDVDHSSIRITLDNPQDWRVIQRIVQEVDMDYLSIRLKEILDFLAKNPEVLAINAEIKRNEGLKVN